MSSRTPAGRSTHRLPEIFPPKPGPKRAKIQDPKAGVSMNMPLLNTQLVPAKIVPVQKRPWTTKLVSLNTNSHDIHENKKHDSIWFANHLRGFHVHNTRNIHGNMFGGDNPDSNICYKYLKIISIKTNKEKDMLWNTNGKPTVENDTHGRLSNLCYYLRNMIFTIASPLNMTQGSSLLAQWSGWWSDTLGFFYRIFGPAAKRKVGCPRHENYAVLSNTILVIGYL